MIVAVLDTNVLVSAFPGREGVPARIPDAWHQERFSLVVSEHILGELGETWQNPYWQARFSRNESAEAIALLHVSAIVTPVTVEVSGIAAHPEDDLVLAAAVASGASYLVTGDRKLQRVGAFRGVTILSPREFLTILESESPALGK